MPSKSADITSHLHVLGKGEATRTDQGPSVDLLESFPNLFREREYIISIEFPEFTSLCPVTGQPDFATIAVDYIPDMLCVESKSFKLYMFAYRSHQSFMETITNNILNDLVTLLSPLWCRIRGLFAPRGATRLNVFAEYFKDVEPQKLERVRQIARDWKMETALTSHIYRK